MLYDFSACKHPYRISSLAVLLKDFQKVGKKGKAKNALSDILGGRVHTISDKKPKTPTLSKVTEPKGSTPVCRSSRAKIRLEYRESIVREWLAAYPSLHAQKFADMLGCTRASAMKTLNGLVWLKATRLTIGKSHTKLFVLANPNNTLKTQGDFEDFLKRVYLENGIPSQYATEAIAVPTAIGAPQQDERNALVLDVIHRAQGLPLTATKVAQLTGLSEVTARRTCLTLAAEGKIRQEPEGVLVKKGTSRGLRFLKKGD